jgi:hypothetical protein
MILNVVLTERLGDHLSVHGPFPTLVFKWGAEKGGAELRLLKKADLGDRQLTSTLLLRVKQRTRLTADLASIGLPTVDNGSTDAPTEFQGPLGLKDN